TIALLPSLTPTPHPSLAHSLTLSLHDALPISRERAVPVLHVPRRERGHVAGALRHHRGEPPPRFPAFVVGNVQRDVLRLLGVHRSEEHTSELQSRVDLVCRLLLEKKHSDSMLS